MIKLTLPPRPAFLTDEKVVELTSLFKSDRNKRVWNIHALKSALLEISYGKCAFSEVRLNVEGKYMQVEHFYPKSKYPEKVMEWGNLLPCLNVCNSKKKDIDPKKKPLVNPFFDDPKDFFYIENGRLIAYDIKNHKGLNTLEAFDLNNPSQLRIPRYKWQCQISKHLSAICEVFDKMREIGKKRLFELLKECGRHSEYSAAKSTAILMDKNYQKMKNSLIENGEWDEAFKKLEDELIFCSLPKQQ